MSTFVLHLCEKYNTDIKDGGFKTSEATWGIQLLQNLAQWLKKAIRNRLETLDWPQKKRKPNIVESLPEFEYKYIRS